MCRSKLFDQLLQWNASVIRRMFAMRFFMEAGLSAGLCARPASPRQGKFILQPHYLFTSACKGCFPRRTRAADTSRIEDVAVPVRTSLRCITVLSAGRNVKFARQFSSFAVLYTHIKYVLKNKRLSFLQSRFTFYD